MKLLLPPDSAKELKLRKPAHNPAKKLQQPNGLQRPAELPMKILKHPVTLAKPAHKPAKKLEFPDVVQRPASCPINVLWQPPAAKAQAPPITTKLF